MKVYALNYKEKKCCIEGKDISYKEIFLVLGNLDVKVTIPKDVKNEVISSIDNGECELRVDYDSDSCNYFLLLRFSDYIIPLNNRIFSPLELWVLYNNLS